MAYTKNKEIVSRIVHKHDTAANWENAKNFIPMKGEIIVYDIDITHEHERFKIGDGVTLVNDLPFQVDISDFEDYKVKQAVVVDPIANGDALAFIDSISQDEMGVITVTKKNVRKASTVGTADQLASLTVTLTGDVTGTQTIKNGNSVSIATDLSETGVIAGAYGTDGKTLNHGDTFTVPNFSVDAEGRLTSAANKTFTLPAPVDISGKMDKTNPTGTGSFSLNRNVNSEIGDYSFAEGYNTIASGKYSHAEGQNTVAFSDYSHAEGRGNITSVTITGAANANRYTLASADSSLLVGQVIFYQNKYAIITAYDSSVPSITVNTTLSDKALNSVSATLYKFAASGSTSHAEGWNTVASGSYSHTEGSSTAASGNSSHAECYHTTASGQFSHAEGCYTTASGDSSHAEGNHTTASGKFSHAGGYFTIADGENQTVIGKHNVSDTTSSFIIGNGTGTNARSNAHTIDGSGNAWFAGDVYVGSTSGKNKDEGSVKLATEEYVDGVTSNIQTQLNGKQATITGAATSITSANLTANRALVSDGSGKVAVSAVTSTELGYLDGVTSAVQSQLDAKIPLAGVSDYTITGNLLFADSGTTESVFRGLQGKCGGNDYWRVGGRATASNAGYMEIATADDGNEPIYVRQYSGTYSTLTRTATLLDGSGNTSFPGRVTAAGATLTSSLNLANGIWNKLGDDVLFGDNNTAGGFAIKGTNGNTNLKMVSNSNDTSASIVYDSTNECLNFVFA